MPYELIKMKPNVDIHIFIGYFESLRGFHIYNHRTRKIIETIHVKFDDLTAMASECNNSGLGFNCLNFQDSSEELNEIPSKKTWITCFVLCTKNTMRRELLKCQIINTLDNEDTLSSSSIIFEDHEVPQFVSSSEEPIVNEPTTLVSDNHFDEQVQEDIAELDINTFINPFRTSAFKEAESSSK
nr:retrovirus-related Pol polyprotein from transposon TNT 1-94 [Tanacetum cinerariifolium]